MYRAKQNRSRVETYDPDLDDGGNVLGLLEELRRAVEQRQFALYYQPQLDIHDRRVIAFEALLRWPHPRLGLVPPLRFLPLAEEAGLMPALTKLVLDEALGQCARWRQAGSNVSVSVNASPTNLLDPEFTGTVTGLLCRHGLPPHALGLRVVAEGVEDRATLELLAELGCDLAQGFYISRPTPADQLDVETTPVAPASPGIPSVT